MLERPLAQVSPGDEDSQAPSTVSAPDNAEAVRAASGATGCCGAHERASTRTGMPTLAKLYVQRATEKGCRTHPCDAGYTGTSPSSWKAIPPTNGSAHGSHSRNGVDHQRGIFPYTR